MPSNQQRREAAKRKLERQLERRAERARKRKQMTIAGSIVGAIVVIAVGAVVVTLSGKDDNSTETTAASETPSAAAMPAGRAEPLPNLVNCAYTPAEAPAKPNNPPRAEGIDTTVATVSASMETTQGPIGLTLNNAESPCTVNSFVSLASQGYFDGTTCHRLVTGEGLQVLQCGDPTGTGSGGPGYQFANEFPTDSTRPTTWPPRRPSPTSAAPSRWPTPARAPTAASSSSSTATRRCRRSTRCSARRRDRTPDHRESGRRRRRRIDVRGRRQAEPAHRHHQREVGLMKRTAFAAAGLGLALLLTACGSDDGGSSDTTTSSSSMWTTPRPRRSTCRSTRAARAVRTRGTDRRLHVPGRRHGREGSANRPTGPLSPRPEPSASTSPRPGADRHDSRPR